MLIEHPSEYLTGSPSTMTYDKPRSHTRSHPILYPYALTQEIQEAQVSLQRNQLLPSFITSCFCPQGKYPHRRAGEKV